MEWWLSGEPLSSKGGEYLWTLGHRGLLYIAVSVIADSARLSAPRIERNTSYILELNQEVKEGLHRVMIRVHELPSERS